MNTPMIQQEKKVLREKLRRLVQQHQSSTIELEQLLHQVQTLPTWPQAHGILLFAPLPHEPNLLSLLDTCSTDSSKHFFFPRMHKTELELYEWFPGAPWIKGPHSIQEPDPKTWRQASLAEADLALIPGLAFDKQGGRLGWGHGYFDRLLGNSECRALKVGIAWSWQVTPKIPREPHDVIMDFVVTHEDCFTTGSNYIFVGSPNT